MFSISIPLLWIFMSKLRITKTERILIITATIFAFPFLTAANQVYSSFLSSTISILSIIWILYRPEIIQKKLYIYDLIILSIIAYQPWLQIKFLAPALISTIAIIMVNFKYDCPLKKIALLILPILLSIILLASYHQYAFGNVFGPYSGDSLIINKTAIMVLIGLHIDQFQGVFLQNPIMFIGLLFLIPFFRWNWKIATLSMLLYLSFIVPNAMHPNWYGGGSYAGRFAWASSLIWMLPTIFGLIQIKKLKPSIFYVIIFSSISLQIYFITKFIISDFSLYNASTQTLESVNTFYAPYQNYFPSFSNVEWAYGYATNYAYVFLFLYLIYLGKNYLINDTRLFLKTLRYYLPLVFLLTIFISIFSSTTPPTFSKLSFLAKDLPTQVGVKINTDIYIEKGTNQGFATYGPYTRLAEGKYKFDISYISSETNTWDVVFSLPGRLEILNQGNLIGSNGNESHLTQIFDITKEYNTNKIEIRTYYHGVGDLTIKSLTITRIQ